MGGRAGGVVTAAASSAATPRRSVRPTRSRAASSPTRSSPGASRRPCPPIRRSSSRSASSTPSSSTRSARAGRQAHQARRQDGQLAPTSRLGTETVARLLGLRLDHPQGQDELELLPTQPATRAEAAYSSHVPVAHPGPAHLGRPGQRDLLAARARRLAADGADPRAQVRRLPVRRSGTSETTQKLWSSTAPGGWVTEPGGFDCSGSCGASTRRSRSPARRRWATSSRGGRPTP